MSSNTEISVIEPTDASEVEVVASSSPAAPATGVSDFVRDHPFLVIVGGVTAGLLVGSLIPRRAGKKVVKRASALSEMVGAAALSLGHDAADRAGAAGTQIRKGSHVLADHAEDWTAVALRSASAFAQGAAENIGKLGETAADKAEQFGEAASDQIGKAGRKTSKRIDKALPIAEAAAVHAGKRLGDAIADLRAWLKG